MRHPGWPSRALITAAVMVTAMTSMAACGGGATSAAPGSSADATAQPVTSSAPAGASQGAPSAAASTAAASTAAGGGGGTGGLACDLVSTTEAAGVVGGGALTAESVPGEPSYCTYRGGDSEARIVTSFVQKDAKVGYDAWVSASDTVKVPGLGDGAIWVPSLATLLIVKGDRVVGITAGTGADAETQRIDWSKALGAIAVAKM